MEEVKKETIEDCPDLKKFLLPFCEYLYCEDETIEIGFKTQENFERGLALCKNSDDVDISYFIGYDTGDHPFILSFGEEGFLADIILPLWYTGTLLLRGKIYCDLNRQWGRDVLEWKANFPAGYLETGQLKKNKYSALFTDKYTNDYLAAFLNSESNVRNIPFMISSLKQKELSAFNCTILLMRIVSAGLSQNEEWNSFLTQGLYDPRLLILIFQMFY